MRHVNGGESYASIARSLAVSPSTVRRRLAALRDPIRWSRDQEARDARTDQITADNTAREVAFDSHDWTLPPAVDADETTALMRCDSCGTELRVRRQGAEPIITPWDYVDLITCPLASPVTPTA
ncbi:hypothetical protein [Nocardioides sp.]|uniref:hypothetical protein n=1 Tax=Nocardioides sp. TaxID=35761 RepID=UPI002B523400|nr:hypothetical protein [Nocardioides sp.]HXH79528.1 hypothetical protein [Nocardioides sp.]